MGHAIETPIMRHGRNCSLNSVCIELRCSAFVAGSYSQNWIHASVSSQTMVVLLWYYGGTAVLTALCVIGDRD